MFYLQREFCLHHLPKESVQRQTQLFIADLFFFLFTIQQQIKTVKNEDQRISTLISSSVGP